MGDKRTRSTSEELTTSTGDGVAAYDVAKIGTGKGAGLFILERSSKGLQKSQVDDFEVDVFSEY